MYRVKIKLAPPFSVVAGSRELHEELPEGSSLEKLLLTLETRYGGDLGDIVQDQIVKSDVLVLVKGEPIRDAQTTLNNEDTVLIALPIGGG